MDSTQDNRFDNSFDDRLDNNSFHDSRFVAEPSAQRAVPDNPSNMAAALETNQRLQDLALIASHEMKAPLRAIRFFSQQILESLENGDHDKAASDVGIIQLSCNQMSQLIESLLDSANVTALSETEQHEPICLNECLNLAITQLRSDIESSKAKLTVTGAKTGAKKVNTLGNKQQISCVFKNIIANALKFCRAGVTPELTINVAESPNKPGFIDVAIHDNGIGIEPQYQEKIFEQFVRVHNQRDYPGSGIGLSLCHDIVNNHQGSLAVSSELGKGSTFTVTLPKR